MDDQYSASYIIVIVSSSDGRSAKHHSKARLPGQHYLLSKLFFQTLPSVGVHVQSDEEKLEVEWIIKLESLMD